MGLSGKSKALILLMVLSFIGLSFLLFAQAFRTVKSDLILSVEICYTDGTSRTVDEIISLSIYDPEVEKDVDHIDISLILVPDWDTGENNEIYVGGSIGYIYQGNYGQVREILSDGTFRFLENLDKAKKNTRIVVKTITLFSSDLDTLYTICGSGNFIFSLEAEVKMKWGVSTTFIFVNTVLELTFDSETNKIMNAFSSPSIPYLRIDYPQTFSAQIQNTFQAVATNSYWLAPLFVIMGGIFGVMAIKKKNS